MRPPFQSVPNLPSATHRDVSSPPPHQQKPKLETITGATPPKTRRYNIDHDIGHTPAKDVQQMDYEQLKGHLIGPVPTSVLLGSLQERDSSHPLPENFLAELGPIFTQFDYDPDVYERDQGETKHAMDLVRDCFPW
jgi:hypothetical protein